MRPASGCGEARATALRWGAAEFLGTFLLVFAGAGAVVIDADSGGGVTPVGIGISFGLAVTIAVVIFGDVSGAHINPAVTVALASKGRLAWRRAPVYVTAQLAGAAAASGVHRTLFGDVADLGATAPSETAAQAALLEFILTFFLLLVVSAVASDARSPTGAAVIVGAYVGLAAIFAGPVAGASMNPARSFGPALLANVWTDHWVYWLAPLSGGIAGAFAYGLLRPQRPKRGTIQGAVAGGAGPES